MKKNKKIKPKEKVKKKKQGGIVRFPARLLNPIGQFLQARLKSLERKQKEIDEEDPFTDVSRIVDNASPDTEAAEQFGHARASAFRTETRRKMVQTKKALSRIKIGKYGICEDCSKMIDTDRLMIYPEATLCAKCQSKREK